MITFITGNQNKLREAKEILGDIRGYELDLPEIQETDPHKIIKAKLKEAQRRGFNNFIVEDTSLYLDELGGLPGPLIKWFLDKLGNDGLYRLVEGKNLRAQAKTVIGYSNESGDVLYCEGTVEGEIVRPRGDTSFGWDTIFKPQGYDKTFAEMSSEEKNNLSMRKMALIELKKLLQKYEN